MSLQALVLLEFLVLRGSEQCIQVTQEDLVYKLEDLETFAYTSPEGKDCGVNVRVKCAPQPTATQLQATHIQSWWQNSWLNAA